MTVLSIVSKECFESKFDNLQNVMRETHLFRSRISHYRKSREIWQKYVGFTWTICGFPRGHFSCSGWLTPMTHIFQMESRDSKGSVTRTPTQSSRFNRCIHHSDQAAAHLRKCLHCSWRRMSLARMQMNEPTKALQQ